MILKLDYLLNHVVLNGHNVDNGDDVNEMFQTCNTMAGDEPDSKKAKASPDTSSMSSKQYLDSQVSCDWRRAVT